MKNLSTSILFCFLFITSISAQDQFKYSKIKIDLGDYDIHYISHLGLETDHGDHAEHKHFINIFDERELQILEDHGIKYKVIIDDVKAFYKQHGTMDESELNLDSRSLDCNQSSDKFYDYTTPENYTMGSVGGYFSYSEALVEFAKMSQLYPNLITQATKIGDFVTHNGNNILHMVISNTPNNIDENKPQILYNALHHAREPNSLSQLIFYMWYVLENYETDEEIKFLVDNTTMFFVPIINPDGYLINEQSDPNGGGLWRKNAYQNDDGVVVGVDLNRNYGYFWGFDDNGSSPNEQSQTYRGPGPFSEPETQAIRQLFIDNKFEIVLNYHTHGNLLIHPWGYSDQPTDEDAVFKSLARTMVSENDFKIGTGTETVGYVVNGDSDDWMYGEQTEKIKAYSMTPEVGPAFWPSASRIDQLNKSTVRHNLNAAHLLLNFGWAREINAEATLVSNQGSLFFEFEKSGLKQGLISFRVESETPELSLSNNVFNDLDLQTSERMEFEVAYDIEDSYKDSTIQLSLVIDNGDFVHKIPLEKQFIPDYTLPILSGIDDISSFDNYQTDGDWNITEEDFFSAPYSITDSPEGDYSNNLYEGSYLLMENSFSLKNAERANLTFYTKFDIEEDYDVVQLQISRDGVNFEGLCGTLTEAPSNDQEFFTTNPVYDGNVEDWTKEIICLDDYVGEENLQLRFVLFSDGFVNEDGFYFDDLELELFGANVLSNQDLDINFIKVHPNPTNDVLNILSEGLPDHSSIQFEIRDVLGKKLYQNTMRKANTKINAQKLDPGVYFIRFIKKGQAIGTVKFIKQ